MDTPFCQGGVLPIGWFLFSQCFQVSPVPAGRPVLFRQGPPRRPADDRQALARRNGQLVVRGVQAVGPLRSLAEKFSEDVQLSPRLDVAAKRELFSLPQDLPSGY